MFQMMYNNLPSSPFRKVENRTMVDNGRKKHIVKKHIVSDVSNHKYIKAMETELIKTQKNIENNKYNKNDKKTIEILKEALIQVFTNNRFMVNQLKKMNKMDSNNEYDCLPLTDWKIALLIEEAHFKSKKIDLIVKPFDIDLDEGETRKLFLILDIVEES